MRRAEGVRVDPVSRQEKTIVGKLREPPPVIRSHAFSWQERRSSRFSMKPRSGLMTNSSSPTTSFADGVPTRQHRERLDQAVSLSAWNEASGRLGLDNLEHGRPVIVLRCPDGGSGTALAAERGHGRPGALPRTWTTGAGTSIVVGGIFTLTAASELRSQGRVGRRSGRASRARS
jgi:hypothetical protein